MHQTAQRLLRNSEIDFDQPVRAVLQSKGGEVHSVTPDASVYRAITIMSDQHIGCLVVLDADQRLAGIISERDYARKIILMGRSSHSTLVHEVMTDPVITISPDQSIRETIALVTSHRVRHLPILDGDAVIGVVSIGDLLKWALEAQSNTIRELQEVISEAIGDPLIGAGEPPADPQLGPQGAPA